jgi:hypothetical protein
VKYELYAGDVTLDFDEKKHVYTVDGEPVISVTGATSIIDKSGPLMWWAVGQCIQFIRTKDDDYEDDEIGTEEFFHDAQRAHLRSSKKAADIGTLVHQWISGSMSFWRRSATGLIDPRMRQQERQWKRG